MMLKHHEGQQAVVLVCRWLVISCAATTTGRAPSVPSAQANNLLAAEVHPVFGEHKDVHVKPISKERRLGQVVGKNRVANLMQAEQLRVKAGRTYKATANSNYGLPIAPNLPEQDSTRRCPAQ